MNSDTGTWLCMIWLVLLIVIALNFPMGSLVVKIIYLWSLCWWPNILYMSDVRNKAASRLFWPGCIWRFTTRARPSSAWSAASSSIQHRSTRWAIVCEHKQCFGSGSRIRVFWIRILNPDLDLGSKKYFLNKKSPKNNFIFKTLKLKGVFKTHKIPIFQLTSFDFDLKKNYFILFPGSLKKQLLSGFRFLAGSKFNDQESVKTNFDGWLGSNPSPQGLSWTTFLVTLSL